MRNLCWGRSLEFNSELSGFQETLPDENGSTVTGERSYVFSVTIRHGKSSSETKVIILRLASHIEMTSGSLHRVNQEEFRGACRIRRVFS